MPAVISFKQRAVTFFENKFTHSATVLAIRAWQPSTFYEVDIHLPEATNMEQWQKVQHINIRVAPLTFRDYTPAGWDAETRTCTLFVDAGHAGIGSSWVKNLKVGDTITYLGISSAHQSLSAGKTAVFLGDQTAVAHFSALVQLAGSAKNIKGAIVLPETEHQHQFAEYVKRLPLTPLPFKYEPNNSLSAWLLKQSFTEDTLFYVIGNAYLVATLRSRLRQLGFSNKQILAQGFWH